jgi:hypothetical protein
MPDQPHPNLPSSHVYVQHEAIPTPANQNEPTARHVYVEPARSSARTSRPAHTLFCDLPSPLPVLPQEVALIRAYLPALLELIAANDNDPSHV